MSLEKQAMGDGEINLIDLATMLDHVLLLVNQKVLGGIGDTQLAGKRVIDTRGIWG